MRVSQAVKVVFRGAVLYGRIWDFDGGIAIVRTPPPSASGNVPCPLGRLAAVLGIDRGE